MGCSERGAGPFSFTDVPSLASRLGRCDALLPVLLPVLPLPTLVCLVPAFIRRGLPAESRQRKADTRPSNSRPASHSAASCFASLLKSRIPVLSWGCCYPIASLPSGCVRCIVHHSLSRLITPLPCTDSLFAKKITHTCKENQLSPAPPPAHSSPFSVPGTPG